MSIIRVKKDARYFTASNEPFNDVRLSWEARGLMGYLLSKPNNWEVNMADLLNKGPAGEHKMRRMLAELRAIGYMNRIRVTLARNLFDWITEVYESPSQNPKTPSRRFSTSGPSTSGKLPDIVNTDSPNTESPVEEEAKPFAKICALYEREIGVLTGMIANELSDAVDTYPAKWIEDAIHEAATANARNWKYCLAILKRWQAQGDQQDKRQSAPPRRGGKKQSVFDEARAALEKAQAEERANA